MGSSFGDRLNTNYVPTDEEATVIKGLLAEPDQKLTDLNSEIEEIQASLKRLLQEKDDLNGHLKAHKALLSPARRLPPDVLREVFHHCLPTDRNPVMTSKEAPVLLGRVCSQWRDISLAAPKLWAGIHIAIPADNVNIPSQPPQHLCDNATRIAAITAWLSRSGACPLSISVFCSRFDSVSNNSVQLYLDTLSQFANRWKHIHFCLPQPVWTSFLPRYRETDVPLLEKIYFDSALGYHGAPGSPGASARRDSGILRAPRLRSVSLIQFESHILHLPFRWAQLAELNLSGIVPSWQPPEGLSVTETLAILALCPNLELFSVQLSLSGFTPLENGDSGLPKVTLNKLRGLSVTESCNTDSSPFFENVTAPAIRHLKFRRSSPSSYVGVPDLQQPNGNGYTNPHRPIHLALAMFIRRALQPIEEFELDAFYLTEMDVMKCLSLLPALKRLSLWSFGGSGSTTSPWATPPGGGNAPWDISLFAFEDKQLRRLTPGVPQEELVEPSPGFGVAPGWITEGVGNWSPLPAWGTVASSSTAPAPAWNGGGVLDINGPRTDDGSGGRSEGDGDNNGSGDSEAPHAVPGSTSTSTESSSDDDDDNTLAALNDIAAQARARSAQPKALCPVLEEFVCSGAMFSDSALVDFLRARSSLSTTTTTTTLSEDPSTSTRHAGGAASSSSPASPTLASSSFSEILAAASPPPSPPVHLRKCKISFSLGREESDETREQLETIRKETGIELEVHYPPMPTASYYRRYSPYDGLPSVPTMGGSPGTVGNLNGTAVMGGGGGSGGVGGGGVAGYNNGWGQPVFMYSAAFH